MALKVKVVAYGEGKSDRELLEGLKWTKNECGNGENIRKIVLRDELKGGGKKTGLGLTRSIYST